MSKILSSLNNYIIKLSKTGFVALIGIYIILLFVLLAIISPKNDYIIIPPYEHVEYAETVNPQIEVLSNRTYNESTGNVDLTYRIIARLTGRYIDGTDPRYELERLQMSASTTTNRMHYFNERTSSSLTNFRTPRSDSFSMSNREYENEPKQIFMNVEYFDKEENLHKETFREDIFELNKKRQFNQNRKIAHNDGTEEITDVELQIIAVKNEDDYEMNIRIIVQDKSKKYHVDMQTWIVTEDGDTLPFAGVYNYSDERTSYTLSNRASMNERRVVSELKPKQIYAKLVYYVVGEEPQTIQYYEEFANLKENFSDLVDN